MQLHHCQAAILDYFINNFGFFVHKDPHRIDKRGQVSDNSSYLVRFDLPGTLLYKYETQSINTGCHRISHLTLVSHSANLDSRSDVHSASLSK